ncbi:kinase-like protein, partial [Polyporus arcularius HHB13444]
MPASKSTKLNLTGSVIDGRYRLIRILGSGSFGVVYRAIDLRAPIEARDRAIKFVSKAGRKDSSIATLRKEMTLHKRVSHLPNVITLHDAYEVADYFVFVMDYCSGGDLGNYLAECGQFTDTEEVKKVILTLLDTVAALHEEGIYHRDLKPHNILISRDRTQVFLADFGLASDISEYEFACGTMAYMPPGMLRKPNAGKADMWALGLILLNMVSGGIPWRRASRISDTFAEFVDDPNYLLQCIPLSTGANRIIRRMLRANPLIRANIADVRAMILELDSFWRSYDEAA